MSVSGPWCKVIVCDYIHHLPVYCGVQRKHSTPIEDPSWSYGSWIYYYLCHWCLSPPTFCVRTPLMRGVLDTTLCDNVCQWLAPGQWLSPGTPVSYTNKTDIHDITELLLKVALKTTHLGQSHCHLLPIWFIFVWFTSSWHGCSWNTAQLTLNGIAQSIFLDHSNIIDLSVTLPLNIFHCRFCVSDIFLTLYKPCHFSFR